jgi:hypothetical protein
MKNSYFVCPNCGETVPANARACRSCGSDENTGWSDNTYLDGIDLPFEDDDYEEIRAREFGGSFGKVRGKKGLRVDWRVVVGVVVLIAMIWAFVLR